MKIINLAKKTCSKSTIETLEKDVKMFKVHKKKTLERRN